MQNTKNLFYLLLLCPIVTFSQVNPYNNPAISSKHILGDISEEQIIKICSSGGVYGTNAILGCAKRDWEIADRELNRVYSQLLKLQITKKEKEKMMASHRKWLKNRDITCNNTYFSLHGDISEGGGSGVPAEFMDCMTDVANKRTVLLKNMTQRNKFYWI